MYVFVEKSIEGGWAERYCEILRTIDTQEFLVRPDVAPYVRNAARRRSKLFLTLCFCINAAGALSSSLRLNAHPRTYYWLDTPALSLQEPPTTTYVGVVNRVCNFLRIFPGCGNEEEEEKANMHKY